MHLQRAYDKYGADAFMYEILELTSCEELLNRENYWLNKLKPFGISGFNIGMTAEAPTRGTKRSPESIAKMANAKRGKKLSQETREKISLANKGKIPTDEHIAKIKATRMANGGYHVSEEARIKIGNSCRGYRHTSEAKTKISTIQSKQYIVITPDGEVMNISGLKQFCREHGLSGGAMCEVAQGKRKHYKGWKCRYDQ